MTATFAVLVWTTEKPSVGLGWLSGRFCWPGVLWDFLRHSDFPLTDAIGSSAWLLATIAKLMPRKYELGASKLHDRTYREEWGRGAQRKVVSPIGTSVSRKSAFVGSCLACHSGLWLRTFSRMDLITAMFTTWSRSDGSA
jgi:hypothetical protein